VFFEDLLVSDDSQPGRKTTTLISLFALGWMIGTGVRQQFAPKSCIPKGNIIQTDNALDVAIDGRGFFQSFNAWWVIWPIPAMAHFQINAVGDMVEVEWLSSGILVSTFQMMSKALPLVPMERSA